MWLVWFGAEGEQRSAMIKDAPPQLDVRPLEGHADKYDSSTGVMFNETHERNNTALTRTASAEFLYW